jgi:hypothetical protein
MRRSFVRMFSDFLALFFLLISSAAFTQQNAPANEEDGNWPMPAKDLPAHDLVPR